MSCHIRQRSHSPNHLHPFAGLDLKVNKLRTARDTWLKHGPSGTVTTRPMYEANSGSLLFCNIDHLKELNHGFLNKGPATAKVEDQLPQSASMPRRIPEWCGR